MITQAVLVGTGGHARSLLSISQKSPLAGFEVVAWLEAPDFQGDTQLMGLPILLQNEEQIDALKEQGCTSFLYGFGSVKASPRRWELFEWLCQQGLQPQTLIHPSASVSKDAEVGSGVFIGANAVVQPFAQVGDACIINTGSIIEHHVTLGRNVHVAPGAVLCGQAMVGEHSLIGAGSTVIQGVQVGQTVTVGAGSTVIRDVVDQLTVVGNPAKAVRSR